MYTQEKVKEYQIQYSSSKYQFREWNNTTLYEWEFRLLFDTNAISYKGIKMNRSVFCQKYDYWNKFKNNPNNKKYFVQKAIDFSKDDDTINVNEVLF